VRSYTVEPGKFLEDTWGAAGSYGLSVYGPNGFVRFFRGSVGATAAALDVNSRYDKEDHGAIHWSIANVSANRATVILRDAYVGDEVTRLLAPGARFEGVRELEDFYGWYDVIVRVVEDSTFEYRLAGHVETGRDSFSDPALGGLVTLKI
jgi:phospholipase C